MSGPENPGPRPISAFFVATAGSGALLLFWIQPLFSKLLLPSFGGTPVVWNTVLLFFQLVLLAGYGYAHLLTRWLRSPLQVLAHLALSTAVFSVLPVSLAETDPGAGNPVLALLWMLSVSIGAPVFLTAATAPLLQRWLADTGVEGAGDPYFLYAASNCGSMLALIAFPFALEPWVTLTRQRQIWSLGFGILTLMVAACGLLAIGTLRRGRGVSRSIPRSPVRWSERLSWLALSAVPASLLVGVTQFITTDVASVPLLWVLPLLAYLLTWVIAFGRRRLLPDHWIYEGQVFALGVAGVWIWAATRIGVVVAVHVGILFVLALVCHRRLANQRPDIGGLTRFYVWIAIGGLAGSAFTTLAAPLLFRNPAEYGIAAVLACMLRPGQWRGPIQLLKDVAWPTAMFGAAIGLMRLGSEMSTPVYGYVFVGLILSFVIVAWGFRNRPLRFGLTAAALLVLGVGVSTESNIVEQHRSYFGSYDIVFSEEDNAYLLYHGTTIHGTQLLDPDRLTRPASYYTERGPLGQAFLTRRTDGAPLKVALIGLGIGSALCYSEPGDSWDVFEVDPLVFAIASDPTYFHHWTACGRRADTRLLIGDARLRLKDDDERKYDLLVLDAYTSDAIPIHLMTLEALGRYRQRLAPGGWLLFHISNRHLSLDRVLEGLSEATGMAAVIQEHTPDGTSGIPANRSVWVVLAEAPGDLAALGPDAWRPLDSGRPTVWTDDYSDILRVLR